MSSRKRRATEPEGQINEDMINTLREVMSSTLAPIIGRLVSLEQSSPVPGSSGSSSSIEVPLSDARPRFENNVVMVQTPTKPTFDGSNNVHPIIFMEDLESYIARIRAQKDDLKVTLDCLTGEARGWARIFVAKWKSFDDFKTDFLDQYWGRKVQKRIRDRISSGKWDPSKNKTLLSHFISVYDEAKMLSQSDERELINQIMEHFPQDVKRMWFNSGGGSAEAAVRFLKTMDMGTDDVGPSKRVVTVPSSERPKGVRMSAAVEQIRSGYRKSWAAAGPQDEVIEIGERSTDQAEN